MPAVKFQDINQNYGVYQTTNIKTAYARAKRNTAQLRFPARRNPAWKPLTIMDAR